MKRKVQYNLYWCGFKKKKKRKVKLGRTISVIIQPNVGYRITVIQHLIGNDHWSYIW